MIRFHWLRSDVPLSAYDINPYGGALSFLPSASPAEIAANHTATSTTGTASIGCGGDSNADDTTTGGMRRECVGGS